MKKSIFWQAFLAILLLAPSCQAQSLKDLFSKENVEKVVSAVTGKNTAASMEGTWNFTGSAIEFESDNFLQKAGGSVAAEAAESKLNEQLSKVGIQEGTFAFTFNADSTFQVSLKGKSTNGTYSYDNSTQKVNLKFSKLIRLNAKITYTSTTMDLLFNADKLLSLLTYLSSKSSNATLQSISSLAQNYDGMMMGFALKKEE